MTNDDKDTKIQMARLETSLTYVSQCLGELKETMKNSTDLLHKIDKSTDAIPILERRLSQTENTLEELKNRIWKLVVVVSVLSSGGTWIAEKFL